MTEKLTGRYRYRSERKWGEEKLILQVEVTGRDFDYAGGFVHGFDYRKYRDATTEDITSKGFRRGVEE